MREIRGRSNLAQSELTRCLRTLESRKLIKSVRSVQAARRKVSGGGEGGEEGGGRGEGGRGEVGRGGGRGVVCWV